MLGGKLLAFPLPPLAIELMFVEFAGGRASLKNVPGFGGAKYECKVFI